ncbi:hypothetical protein [Companilactobacillus nuruki]|uniref:hypothetical protein n=1 Tax=Companilactobacillus nuruki TaxID=1993540 RepID=UPI00141702A5|nr:hypothetical protein [Companilactobacillus nuruki]
MKWYYKSVEFWIGILITMAFFQLFFTETFGFMWWTGIFSSIIGMLLIFNVIGKLKV